MEKSERERNLKEDKRKRTVEWTIKNFVTNEIQENAKTHEPLASICQSKQTNKTNKRADSKKNVKNTRSKQNNKTNKRDGSKNNVKKSTSKQNKTNKSKSSSSKNKKNNVNKKNSGEDSTKKKSKKKGEEEISSSSDSDESSTESAVPGETCRNCSRGNIDQLFQDAEAADFGFPEYVPHRPVIEDP